MAVASCHSQTVTYPTGKTVGLIFNKVSDCLHAHSRSSLRAGRGEEMLVWSLIICSCTCNPSSLHGKDCRFNLQLLVCVAMFPCTRTQKSRREGFWYSHELDVYVCLEHSFIYVRGEDTPFSFEPSVICLHTYNASDQPGKDVRLIFHYLPICYNSYGLINLHEQICRCRLDLGFYVLPCIHPQ